MNGPQPIRISEMLAFFQIAQIEDPDQRMRYARLIQQLDGVYTEFAAKRAEAAQKAKGS